MLVFIALLPMTESGDDYSRFSAWPQGGRASHGAMAKWRSIA
jgi:hypothetical protein